ncbi:hypothetical protein [Desulfobacter latus]|uniref:Uncharacterized protein n=1 Tax=Desulfobacter latus TaxID=2292 RepID=A0A850T3B2_9BACT|nr:hypothetical protein [Desulfobacter latus]NWH06850.1 hypothetical protein [Desulfobacter latus]
MIFENDGKRFGEIMFGLAENYPGTNLSTNGLMMRFEAMKEFSIDQVGQAATKLLKTHRFNTMPTVGDFISTIDAASGNIPVEDRAEIEANKVLDHLHRHGKGVIPEFEDPITKHLMSTRWRYGSWASHVVEDELKWWHKDFVRAYRAHAVGAGVMNCLPDLSGLKQLTGKIGNWGKEVIHAN